MSEPDQFMHGEAIYGRENGENWGAHKRDRGRTIELEWEDETDLVATPELDG